MRMWERMSLPWVRLDTGFPHNPKVLALIAAKKYQAVNLYVFGLAYSGAHGLDGYIPPECLPVLHATRTHAAQLVDAGLWRSAGAGWEINGWDEFQLSSEEHSERKARAKAAAEKRWAKGGRRVQPIRRGGTA